MNVVTIESRSVSFHGGERQIVSGMLMLGKRGNNRQLDSRRVTTDNGKPESTQD